MTTTPPNAFFPASGRTTSFSTSGSGFGFIERDCCPACSSTDTVTLWRCGFTEEPLGSYLASYYLKPIPEGTYQLDQCENCSLIFQRFIGTDAFLTKLYSEWLNQQIDDEYRDCLANYRGSRDAHELMALSAYLGRPKLKVLDYGAGWGLWPIIASRLGHQAFAVEIAPEKASWMQANGVTIFPEEEIANHAFDVINLEQVLEHVPEPGRLLQSLVPSLSGVLKVAVPNASYADVNAFRRSDLSRLTILLPFEHINGFTGRAMRVLARSVGLREVRPSLRQLYSFDLRDIARSPKRMVKELVRPLITWHRPSNIYAWFIRA